MNIVNHKGVCSYRSHLSTTTTINIYNLKEREREPNKLNHCSEKTPVFFLFKRKKNNIHLFIYILQMVTEIDELVIFSIRKYCVVYFSVLFEKTRLN